jgi:hypothetical protein
VTKHELYPGLVVLVETSLMKHRWCGEVLAVGPTTYQGEDVPDGHVAVLPRERTTRGWSPTPLVLPIHPFKRANGELHQVKLFPMIVH